MEFRVFPYKPMLRKSNSAPFVRDCVSDDVSPFPKALYDCSGSRHISLRKYNAKADSHIVDTEHFFVTDLATTLQEVENLRDGRQRVYDKTDFSLTAVEIKQTVASYVCE